MVNFIIIFVCAIVGFIIGKKAVNKGVVKWALKAGIDQAHAETLYYLLNNGNKLERAARKEAAQRLKAQLVAEQLSKSKEGGNS